MDFYAGRPASRESVILGIKVGDIPTEAKIGALQELIKQTVEANQMIELLTPEERQLLAETGKSSRERRRGR